MGVKRGSFRFRKNDSLGAAGAEEDGEFLRECFVDTGDLHILEDLEDNRELVVGRTGSGKTALLSELAARNGDQAIVIDPEHLALTYVSNSTILRFFADLGVNLDPFFKLLWRHVLTVEVLDRHFSIRSETDQKGLWGKVKNVFVGDSREEREAREALDYLQKWGSKFWKETEYRVKEITQTLEEELGAELDAKLGAGHIGAGAKLNAGITMSSEQRAELHSRGQKIVTSAQVQDLGKIIRLLDRVLTNKQRGYYIIVDKLDEAWVEDSVRYKLIMALILTARDFLKVKNAKVLVALRKDLIDRVFRLARESGFQQEKYESLCLRMHWSKEEILTILDRRVGALVRRRYTKEAVTHADLFPARIDKIPIDRYVFDRASRPRDVIDLGNKCILASTDSAKVSVRSLRTAEGEYSRSRLRAVADEWSADYPNLPSHCRLLRGCSASTKLSRFDPSRVENECLRIATDGSLDRGELYDSALDVAEGRKSPEEHLCLWAKVLYKTGIVGLKLDSHEPPSWNDDLGRSVSTSEVTDDTSIVVHPAFHRVFGIKS